VKLVLRNSPDARRSGIALIIVLIVVVVLGILAGGFAYTMRVETTLARNASFNTELDWIGRAGVGYCQWLLSSACPQEPYDALNQAWAKGTGGKCTNDAVLSEVNVGTGSFTWEIVDQDRYFNINRADEMLLKEALTLIGVDAGQMTTIVNSILDWRDPDKNPRMSGTETEVYEQQDPPYVAKDGPFDDMSELLLIRGITPGMYRGSSGGPVSRIVNRAAGQQSVFDEPVYSIGFRDLFCALSGPTVNINTASANVLQTIPGFDENIANAIIQHRAGPDGAEGSMDDSPYPAPGMVATVVPGIDPTMLARFFGVRSMVFKATITAKIAGASRQYVAYLQRAPVPSGKVQDTRVIGYYSISSEGKE
jgi:general secretion pathway protein K